VDGFNGLSGLFDPMGSALGIGYYGYQYFFMGFCLAVLALVYLFVERISGSRWGLAIRSIREDERAATAFGRNVYSMRLRAYVLGAALGGLAGGLFAGYLTAFNPSAWTPIETIVLYAAVFVGGRGNSRGVVAGVLLVSVLFEEATRFLPQVANHPSLAPAMREVIIGLIIVIFLRYRPQGIFPERRLVDPLATALAADGYGLLGRPPRPLVGRRRSPVVAAALGKSSESGATREPNEDGVPDNGPGTAT
ncbi:MAG: branched-chain amino acid ABC transporter permease, partial [Acidimicrobiales bacterium]